MPAKGVRDFFAGRSGGGLVRERVVLQGAVRRGLCKRFSCPVLRGAPGIYSAVSVSNAASNIFRSRCGSRITPREPPGVFRLCDPEPQVTAFGVFLLQMCETTGILLLAVQFRTVRQPVLHGAADDRFGVDHPVGLGHDPAVNGAGFAVRRGAVVLHGVAHHRDLFFGEPAAQFGVGRKNASGVDVVPFAAVCETRVVIGGDGVNHVGVRVVMCSQLKALRNDRPDVVRAVRGVEIFVSGNDFPFDISFEFLVHGCKGMKSL